MAVGRGRIRQLVESDTQPGDAGYGQTDLQPQVDSADNIELKYKNSLTIIRKSVILIIFLTDEPQYDLNS